jgi:Cu(I)/Ag(I) efflux system membrane fusion protein
MNAPANNLLKKTGIKPLTVILLIIVLAVGFGLGRKFAPDTHDHSVSAEQAKPQIWTCSMHPEVRLPKPGLCPKCQMPLIPATDSADEQTANPRRYSVSENAKALMDIATAPVERKFVTAHVRMVGKITYDETRLAYITSWVPGRLDRLYVDYTGIPVNKGDHMVYMYSPELLSAQEELLQSKKAVRNISAGDSSLMRDITSSTLDAAREKLRLLGLSPEQISEIETSAAASDHITINSPASGIVVHKNAQEGMYVTTGTRIYTIADLSNVWAKLDAYESDLVWLRYGQPVEFSTVSYPGDTFTGTVSFIDPVLDSVTRTVKVRVEIPNLDGKLKPEMFVRALVKTQIASQGKVMDPDLAGKWICPMHPSIVKDSAGSCDICDMPLVRTESLGYVAADPDKTEAPLVIPATAALVTGVRAVVYVEIPDTDKPTYEGREIVLGPRAGDYYIVRSGLEEGERVVVRGNFKIDSALQIQARPSMMSPGGSPVPMAHNHGAMTMPASSDTAAPKPTRIALSPVLQSQLGNIYARYFSLQSSLAADNYKDASAVVPQIRDALSSVDMTLFTADDHNLWMNANTSLVNILTDAAKAQDIESLRRAFALLSEQFFALVSRFGPPPQYTFYHFKCPMAFNNRGATWLQPDKQTSNPYFGRTMLQCGSVIDVMTSSAGTPDGGSPND